MGITSSRTVLLSTPQPRKSEIYPRPDIDNFSETHRLVRDELRKETQRGVFNKISKTRNCLPVVQVAPEGLQQKDVRPVLQMEEDKISWDGHNRRPAKLL